MYFQQFTDTEIEQQVLARMRELDIEPYDERIIIDGELHRYRTKRDRTSQTSGAYCIHPDGIPAGFIQDWRTGIKEDWKFDTGDCPQEKLDYFKSKEFEQKTRQAQKQREEERKQKQTQAAEHSRQLWEQLQPAAEDHPYLRSKQIYSYGFRLRKSDNWLAVPLRDINGVLKSIQWIAPDGAKRFQLGAPNDDVFFSIALDTLKGNPEQPILIGEGVATMCKVYELTGYPCIAAKNCGSLLKISQIIRKKYPKNKIIITADDDKETELETGNNAGIKAAKEVCDKKLAEGYVSPPFKSPEDGSDWDDFAIKYGDESCKKVLCENVRFQCLPKRRQEVSKCVSIINAEELRHKVFPPVKWAIPGFLPAGLSILAGGPKIGKSIMSLHLCLSVAIGGYALGKILVEQGEVLYLALEDPEWRIKERIIGSDIPEDVDISPCDIINKIPKQHEGGLEYIRWWLEDHSNARLVVIDTLQKFRKPLSSKGNIYSEDYETMSEIKKLADEFGVAILIIHHLKKSFSEDWLNEISGSQGIAGAADTILSVKRARTENKGILHRTGRDVEEKDFALRLDMFGWYLEGEAEVFTMPEWERQIIDYLKEHGTVSPMQLSEAVSISIEAAKKNLQRLYKKGGIQRVGHGTYAIE